MTSNGLREKLEQHSVRLLIRYLKSGQKSASDSFHNVGGLDIRILSAYWSISREMRDLAELSLRNSHQIQSKLEARLVQSGAYSRGSIDAVRTLVRRRTTGDPAVLMVREPNRTQHTNENFLLFWVISYAYSLAKRFRRIADEADSPLLAEIDEICQLYRRTLSLEAFSSLVNAKQTRQRPGNRSIQAALRSRVALYRSAALQFRRLLAIEAGAHETISALLADSIYSPREEWRLFELATALSVIEALSYCGGAEPEIFWLAPTSRNPIAKVADLAIYWQRSVASALPIDPEPSEIKNLELLKNLGVKKGVERSDISIFSKKSGNLLCVIEVKRSEQRIDYVLSALKDALKQVIRYSRYYMPLADANGIISASAVAISVPDELLTFRRSDDCPYIFSADSILSGGLHQWAERLLSDSESE
jgi:hypothetical protein